MNDLVVQYQRIQPFPFYSINECEHQQLLCNSKFPVYLYQHFQSKLIYVVKEIPFKQKYIWIYRILDRMKNDINLHVVHVFSLSLMFMKNKKQKQIKFTSRIPNNLSKNFEQFLANISNNNQPNQNMNNNQKSQTMKKNSTQKQKIFNNSWLLIWMEKCQMNLVQYVTFRRKHRKYFTCQQAYQFFLQLLVTFQKLQKQGLCHRDIKPQNILYQKGKYLLCDFDQCIITKNKDFQTIKNQIQFTTILYSSCQFLKALRFPKNKFFDPYKLDVYSFGLTLLYFCSMGKFNVQDRHPFLYGETGSHQDFISEQRRIYIKRNPQLKIFNCILKLMLQEDEYKRDDFITLSIKVKLIMNLQDYNHSDSVSDYSRRDRSLSTNVSSLSSLRLKNKPPSQQQQTNLKSKRKQIKKDKIKNTSIKHRSKKGFATTKKQQKTLIFLIIGIFLIYTILLIF